MRLASNPPNPFLRYSCEWQDVPPEAPLVVYEEKAKSIISENESPDIAFRYSINPYRGCHHACTYCYARPSHQYLDFGAGTDFERKLVAKVNAAELLEGSFNKRSWVGERLLFSGITDCYQPLEAAYELTRQCLEVCLRYRNPVTIITKGALIQRDIELLQKLSAVTRVRVIASLAFSDDELSRAVEPFAPRPSTRFRTLAALSQAGIKTAIAVAPIIPGLNDTQIPQVLQRAKEAGADSAFFTLLRLPGPVEEIFFQRLKEALPERAQKIESAIRAARDGKLNNAQFGKRMIGEGESWKAIEWLFHHQCEKLGLNTGRGNSFPSASPASTFRRPTAQLSLFPESL